jgi:hypothetical protein
MKFRYASFLFLSFCFPALVFAQNAPAIEWQKSLGGTSEDGSNAIQLTADGGFVIAGHSYSSDNDVTVNQGASDYWIVKTDAIGSIQWQVSLGGSSNDVASAIQQTTDGGYIVAGFSRSNNGDVTGHHGTTAYNDYWVVKLDSAGSIEWEKSLGGTLNEFANSVQQTAEGDFIIAGYSVSNDGDVTNHHGGTTTTDYWIVKLSSSGTLLWQKSLGGTSADNANAIQQTTDGGFIVAGSSSSNDNDVSGNHGFADYWIVKLDSAGDIEWQKCLGGSGDDVASSIRQTSDGGFIVAGWSDSDDNDVSGNHGNYDYWVAKLFADGNIDWQKSLGGATGDFANSIEQISDSGFVIAGYTSSNNSGDVSGYHGGVFFGDYWIVKLDESGNFAWQKCLGGTNDEYAASAQQTIDGGLIVTGWTESSDGDVSFNYGSSDVWIVQLGIATSVDYGISNSFFSLSPNPAAKFFNLSLQLGVKENINATITITNLLGEKVFSKESSIMNGSLEEVISLDEKIPEGMYLVKVGFGSQQMIRPLVVAR